MSSLYEDADKQAQQIRAKREAEKASKEAAKKAAEEAIAKQKQHEEDKRQGMI